MPSFPIRRSVVAALLFVAAVSGCTKKDAEEAPVTTYPRLLYRPAHKPLIQERAAREPYATAMANVRKKAAEEPAKPEKDWSEGVWSRNGNIALANAVLAWVFDDEAAAAKARTILLSLETNFETNNNFDVNITMPRVLVTFSGALDLMRATPWLTAAEAKDAGDRIGEVTAKFADKYLDVPIYRLTALVVTQNNHPIRTATALGYAALAVPEHPDAPRWLNWAVSEFDYLLKEKGHYLQPDGAISEGPFYGQFGLSAAYTLLIALDNAYPKKGPTITRTCFSRNDKDPWTEHGCVEGETFVFENPLRQPLLYKVADWLVAMRMPSGMRAYISDSKDAALHGAALLTGFGAPGYLIWDWENHDELPKEVEKHFYLAPWYLAYMNDATPATKPEWKNRFFETSGHAVFRSGWERDDLWLALVSDKGPARKTLHNHGDGTSYAFSAYGENFILDPGYYKKNELNNPATTDFPSHNVVLVNGGGPPERGLLDDFGDTDAFLENVVDGEKLAWAESRMSYQGIEIRRGIAFVRERYFIVADRIETDGATPQTFSWRTHLWAGRDAGGAYTADGSTITITRDKAGMALAITSSAGQPVFVEPPFEEFKAPYVHQLREQIEFAGHHAVVDAEVDAAEPDFLAVLAPHKAGSSAAQPEGPLTITSLAAGAGGAAWLIDGADGKEVAWIRKSSAPASLTVPGGIVLQSDARVVIVSLTDSAALIAEGTFLKVNGTAKIAGNKLPVKVME